MSKKTWIFDLDDTLHYASRGIFDQINRAMTTYIMQHLAMSDTQAHQLRQRYWQQYGATLRGLMAHHAVDPSHFLQQTHLLVELERDLVADPGLARTLQNLAGRKLVFSNGPTHYIEGMLQRLAIRRYFSTHYGIEQVAYLPKPHISAFRMVLSRERLRAQDCIMVEDSLANLRTAKRLGMTTVWLSRHSTCPAYVDLRITRLPQLLEHTWLSA